MSPQEMWSAYLHASGKSDLPMPDPEHFCDNERDADLCADLVLRGIKRATCSALYIYGHFGESLSKPGDVWLVTNWAGEAQCVLETTKVDIVRFHEVSEEFAAAEGEGDLSLAYWREAHIRFFTRQFQNLPFAFTEDIPLVCQYFSVVYR